MYTTCNASSMPNFFETNWPSKTLAKGDQLLVPPASKLRRKLWNQAQMPAWHAPYDLCNKGRSPPWWLLKKGQVLFVRARAGKHFGVGWVNIEIEHNTEPMWILSSHAYVCQRYKPIVPETIVTAQKREPARPARLSDLRANVVLEYNNSMAIVLSWSTDKLPTKHEMALVRIEHTNGIKDVWLSQLTNP